MEDTIRVILPEKYDLVVGDTFQLFYRGVVEAVNPYFYEIVSVCEKGHNFPRYFEFTPEEEGEYTLYLSVFSNNKTKLAEGKTRLCVNKPSYNIKKPVNILCVGDSLTQSGVWVEEARRRIADTGGEPAGLGIDGVNFIGTCHNGKSGYEGHGGWQWKSYLKTQRDKTEGFWIRHNSLIDDSDQHSLWKDENDNIWIIETIEKNWLKFKRGENNTGNLPDDKTKLTHLCNAQHTDDLVISEICGEKKNPFYSEKTGKIDFADYCNENGFDGIDIAYFMLTWNGLSGMTGGFEDACKDIISQAKELINILHSQYPEAKVKIMGLQVPSVNGGTGTNYGAVLPYCDRYGLTRYVMELNIAFEKFTMEEGYCKFMEFINISGQFDSENNMPAMEKCVNTRSPKKEIFGINGVHPLKEGYLQIADAVYRNIVKSINELA